MAVEGLSGGDTAVLDEAPVTSDWPVSARTPARPADARARLFVWGSWTAMFGSTLGLVLANARNFPIYEDWLLVPPLTGHQNLSWSWLWAQNNEHRVPLPKLIYLGLLKLWPDFRVGMVFSIVVVAAVAAAFIVFMRRRRGYTRWTDAFFPVVLVNLGHWENLGWSWQLQFVVATALACGVLMGVASKRELSTARALALGGCLVAIPFTGATALPFAPLVALALIPRLRRTHGRPARTILVTSIVLTLVVTVVYFVGLKHPVQILSSPSPWATIETGLKSMAVAFGPAAGAWWFVSILAVTSVVAGAAVVLYRARRAGTWALLAFLAGGLVLAVEVGYSRAGNFPWEGMPDRYALIAAPVLCCAYLAYDRYGGRRWRRLGPGLLCGGVIALLPLNVDFGFQFRDWYHARVDPFVNDIEAGVPVGTLAYEGYFGTPAPLIDLHQARLGVFTHLQEKGTIAPGREIDGFDVGGGGWYTLGGASSVGVLRGSGAQRVLRWDFNSGGAAVPVLGKSFVTPQDWRGAGAIGFTVVGQGSGRTVDVRLVTASGAGPADRYDSTFVDDQAGTRTIAIPWDGFAHLSRDGHFDPQGPVPLEHVVAVVFGVTEPTPGSLVIQRVALEPGHGPLSWPSWSASTRRSLPPWR